MDPTDTSQYAAEAASVRSQSSQRMGGNQSTTENNPHALGMRAVGQRSSQRMGNGGTGKRMGTGRVTGWV